MRRRDWIGILATPLVVSLISLVLTPSLMKLGIFVSDHERFPSQVSFIVKATEFLRNVGFNYFDAIIFGLPTLLFLRWRRIASWYGYAIAGFVVLFAIAVVWTVAFAFADSGEPFTFTNLIGMWRLPIEEPVGMQLFLAPPAVYGPLTALIYWLIARPDLAKSTGV